MKYRVEFGEDYIAIKRGKKEICYWIEDEWKKDSQIVFCIANAIYLAASGKNKILDEIASLAKER